MDTSSSYLKLALENQNELFTQFRIQGSSIKESKSDDLECLESDIDENSEIDDTTVDPTWTPNDKSDKNSENEISDEDERIKRKYRKVTQEIRQRNLNQTDGDINGANILDDQGKRKLGKDNWEKNKNKRLRMQGAQYFGLKKGQDGKYSFTVAKEKRNVAPRSCTKRCKQCPLFTEDERNEIFIMFWENMNWEQKKVFITSMVDKFKSKETKTENSRRQYSFRYFLKKEEKKIQVCKKMFLTTLGIGERQLYEWISKSDSGIPDKPKENVGFRRNPEGPKFANEFLDALPKLPSHYCRANSSRLYLEPVFTSFNELYREYKKHCEDNGKKEISVNSFRKIFEDKSLSLFRPKKDQCDVCCGHETQNISEEAYNLHLEKKEQARTEKTQDKDRALNSEAIKVITLDLQAVLLCPFLQASAMYYKTKLACHNFTIHDMKSKDVVCYFWDESQGDLTANSFASCVADYIENLEDCVKELIIFSDGCTYQNRNSTLANTLLHYAHKKRITITQKILEKGHTQMECDSIHSTIERKLRNKPIYTPQSYVDLIKGARLGQPYTVKYLTYDFFRNFSELGHYSSIRPGSRVGDPVVTEIRVLKYSPEGSIQYKLRFTDDFMDLPRRAKQSDPSDENRPKQLYDSTIAIKRTKFQHLQDLKSVLPRDFHPFYDNLSWK